MSKIIQSAAALLLTTSVFATSIDANASSSAQKEKANTHQINNIPSQSGLWINTGMGLVCAKGKTMLSETSENGKVRYIAPSLYGGLMTRYHRKKFLCSASADLGYMPLFMSGDIDDRSAKNRLTLHRMSWMLRGTIGYQGKHHGVAAYLQHAQHFNSFGIEYSYLFGKALLLQTRIGFSTSSEKAQNHHAVFIKNCTSILCCGLDVGIHVAYKVC